MSVRSREVYRDFFILIILLSLLLCLTKPQVYAGQISVRYKSTNQEQKVSGIPDICRELLDKTEFVAIVTWDGNKPHLVATWGDFVRKLGIKDNNIILIPAGSYHKTEENLKKNSDIQLMIASKQVQGTHDLGQGCVIYGEGEIQIEGEYAFYVKEKFPWARGALVVKVKEVELHL